MDDRSLRRYIFLFLGAVLLLSVPAWITLYTLVGSAPKTAKDEMLIELSKALAQLVFITLVGSTATFLYNQYGKEQDRYKSRLQEEQKNRRELLDTVIDVRARVEQARRAYALVPPPDKKEGYRQSIEALLQARLALSQVWHDILTLQTLYPGGSEAIQDGLTGMKRYLDCLIQEYESQMDALARLPDEEVAPYIAGLPNFGKFVTGEGGEAYTQDFLEKSYRKSARLLRHYLLEAGA